MPFLPAIVEWRDRPLKEGALERMKMQFIAPVESLPTALYNAGCGIRPAWPTAA